MLRNVQLKSKIWKIGGEKNSSITLLYQKDHLIFSKWTERYQHNMEIGYIARKCYSTVGSQKAKQVPLGMDVLALFSSHAVCWFCVDMLVAGFVSMSVSLSVIEFYQFNLI